MKILKDEELLFLCNLMYLHEEVVKDKADTLLAMSPFKNLWIEENYGKPIRTLISSIDIGELRRNELLSRHKFDGAIAGAEWADMLEAMNQSMIINLTFEKIFIDDKKAMNVYFTDDEGNGYIVFHGTGMGEWVDNFEGGFVSETDQQKRAIEFVESIDNNNLTVVGHSKGGNKAKYVALLLDKVTRCVSFDGQGFSKEFMEEYAEKIKQNKYKITCYALGNDFVNIFLHDICAKKRYIVGNGVSSFEENHSPNSFYHFYYNSNGHVSGYELIECEQGELLKQVQEFCNFILENPESNDKEKMLMSLGEMVQMLLGKKPPDYTKRYSVFEILYYLKRNTGNFKLFWYYFKAYEKHDMYKNVTQ